MKVKNLLTLLFILLSSSYSFAQKSKFDIDAFKQKKADYIVTVVGMTETEASLFIPLSNELLDKKFEINREARLNRRNLRKKENKTDADYNLVIESNAEAKLKEAQLEKEYLLKFKKILSSEKIYKYQQAEADFMKDILEKRKSKSK